MSQEHSLLTLKIEGSVARIVLNNPPLNILTLELRRQLLQAIEKLEQDKTLRILVISSALEKAFSVGSDLGEFPSDEVGGLQKIQYEQFLLDKIERLDLVTIAAVNGFVLGGGAELMLACDLRVAREDTRIAFPEVKVGGFPAAGGVSRLARDVGPARAREMLLFGDTVDAAQARTIGLVNQCVSAASLETTIQSVVERLLALPQSSLLAIKHSLRAVFDGGSNSSAVARTETEEFGKLFHGDDIFEGNRAFLEKRRPHFNKRFDAV